MTLSEIERIQAAFRIGKASDRDFQAAIEEALKFHHKVSQLQEILILIKKHCQMEMNELETGKPVTRMHMEMTLEYIVRAIEESQHIRAA